VDYITSLWVLWVILFFIGLGGLIVGVVLMVFDPLVLLLAIFGGFKGYWKICCSIMLISFLLLAIAGLHTEGIF
jgi:hypothetical protein